MSEFEPMPPAWQPNRDRTGMVWGAAVLLVTSIGATLAAWRMIAFARYLAATDPIEGLVVLAPAAGGFFALFAGFVLALAGIVMARADGVPTTPRRTVTTAAVICLCMSIAVPFLAITGIAG
ncbi:hypothetical protein FHX48_000748 [Microbacterium halimionae]|uniref:Uncharacterized protein n=1 Tax=Microbacterium halimionae TaxID=1526413 RepID=A0A7W3PL77_9MICO|nr:hypothetical protein [Microbacterium halimionae]MBA8815696.1 hypothetical protein [Microbacterium halimionae]NII95742.1 hypothetical protein [Microbacterium halimionae]